MKKILPFILLTIILIVGCILVFTNNNNLSNNNVPNKQKLELENIKEDQVDNSIKNPKEEEVLTTDNSVKEDEKIETNKKDDVSTNNSNSNNSSSKNIENKNQSNTSNVTSNKEETNTSNNNSTTSETTKEESITTTTKDNNMIDMTVEFYKSITNEIKEFQTESEALARGYEIANNEANYVMDWNEANPDNPINSDINYFRVYPSAIKDDGTYWYYLHFFCASGEDKDAYLKSKF